MELQKIPVYFVAQRWWQFAPHLEAVQRYAEGEWTNEQMKSDVHTGRVEIIAVMDGDDCAGAVAYVMQNRRNSRTAFIVATGGKALATDENFEQLKQILIDEGATEIEGAGRPSAVRLWSQLGFKRKYEVFGVSL